MSSTGTENAEPRVGVHRQRQAPPPHTTPRRRVFAVTPAPASLLTLQRALHTCMPRTEHACASACRDLGCLERDGKVDGFCARPRALGTLAPELANIK